MIILPSSTCPHLSVFVNRERQMNEQENESRMGRTKSVLSSIPTYPMSCLKLPFKTCNKIGDLIRDFWQKMKDILLPSIGILFANRKFIEDEALE